MSRPGYRFGLKQPGIPLKISFVPPARLDLTKLDQWILDGLEADVRQYQPIYSPGVQQTVLTVLYLQRLLLVTNVLCQDVRIPLFERAVILNIDGAVGKSGLYSAHVWLPVVDGLAEGYCVAWLEIAHKLLTEICTSLESSEAVADVYERFQQEDVVKWLKMMSGGKSTIPLVEGAFGLDIPFAYYGAGCYVLGWGSRSLIFDRSSSGRDSAIGSRITHYKDAAIQMMKSAGVPVPRGCVCRATEFSMAQVSHLQYPLVVKPVDRDRGEGVCLGIGDPESLQAGFSAAAKYSTRVMVEEEVKGTCHRILVVNGRIVFAVKRNPRSVTGDGVHSIAELVSMANKDIFKKVPQKRLPQYEIDALALKTIASQGVGVDSIPANGRKIELRPVQSSVWGSDPEVVTERLHPANAEIAIRAAALFGLACAGVDLISSDISLPWYENGGAITEVNYSPVMGRTYAYQRLGIRAYLQAMFPKGGKIPLEIFVGPDLKDAVINRHKEYVLDGISCFVSLAHQLLDEQLDEVRVAGVGSQPEAIRMLQANRRVGALLVYVDEPFDFLRLGLPFGYVTRIVTAKTVELSDAQKRVVDLLVAYLPLGAAIELVNVG